MNRTELTMLQSLPLDIKIAKSKLRIMDAINHFGVNGVYVPVSGGLDSMVLSHLVEQLQKEWGIEKSLIPRVNSNTGLEFEGVLKKARELSDIEVRPKMTPYEMWGKVGYPIGSKKVSRMISDIQNPTGKNYHSINLYLNGIKKDGSTGSPSCKLAKKYYPFIDDSIGYKIKISHKCCDVIKKEPLKKYEKETKRIPILGLMADEKGVRELGYLQTGCNAFSQGKSLPIGFWVKNDILEYIVKNKLEYAKEYGEIILENGKYKTTGEDRTGCFACPFGVEYDGIENRFQRMKRLNPRLWKFTIQGGEIKNGYLKPKNGLGMGKLLELLNIKYE